MPTHKINADVEIEGNATAVTFTGILQGAVTGAPDTTIWRVSGQYPTWGIFYDESTPDIIQFKSSGNTKATIALDNVVVLVEQQLIGDNTTEIVKKHILGRQMLLVICYLRIKEV